MSMITFTPELEARFKEDAQYIVDKYAKYNSDHLVASEAIKLEYQRHQHTIWKLQQEVGQLRKRPEWVKAADRLPARGKEVLTRIVFSENGKDKLVVNHVMKHSGEWFDYHRYVVEWLDESSSISINYNKSHERN